MIPKSTANEKTEDALCTCGACEYFVERPAELLQSTHDGVCLRCGKACSSGMSAATVPASPCNSTVRLTRDGWSARPTHWVARGERAWLKNQCRPLPDTFPIPHSGFPTEKEV